MSELITPLALIISYDVFKNSRVDWDVQEDNGYATRFRIGGKKSFALCECINSNKSNSWFNTIIGYVAKGQWPLFTATITYNIVKTILTYCLL